MAYQGKKSSYVAMSRTTTSSLLPRPLSVSIVLVHLEGFLHQGEVDHHASHRVDLRRQKGNSSTIQLTHHTERDTPTSPRSVASTNTRTWSWREVVVHSTIRPAKV